MIVVRKTIDEMKGQKLLIEEQRYLFYKTNDRAVTPPEIVFQLNDRCEQENLIEQLKNGPRSLNAPVDNLYSNWAYMLISSLAWTLKAWLALSLPEMGRWKELRRKEKFRLARVLDFLIEKGYSDPKRIGACGTSRGGFLAVYFAASDPRVRCVAGFAPVTDLAELREFKGMEDNSWPQKLSLEKHAAKFAKRHVWIGIGDQDQRVSTDSAIQLARQLTTAKSLVELHGFPEPRGHPTPKGSPEMFSRWILSVTQ